MSTSHNHSALHVTPALKAHDTLVCVHSLMFQNYLAWCGQFCVRMCKTIPMHISKACSTGGEKVLQGSIRIAVCQAHVIKALEEQNTARKTATVELRVRKAAGCEPRLKSCTYDGNSVPFLELKLCVLEQGAVLVPVGEAVYTEHHFAHALRIWEGEAALLHDKGLLHKAVGSHLLQLLLRRCGSARLGTSRQLCNEALLRPQSPQSDPLLTAKDSTHR